jgi:nucleoside 2-deoxyribosyltransferase
MRKIYLASSWRNQQQPSVVAALREAAHEVYDFRNPHPGKRGFAWSAVDPNFATWSVQQFIAGLDTPVAQKSFEADLDALDWADTCILLLPCERSAHLELGYCIGRGKRSIIVLSESGFRAELMYRLADVLVTDIDELLATLT